MWLVARSGRESAGKPRRPRVESVGSRSPAEMVGSAPLALALAAIALATVCAHLPSHDNILRIQLWDAEGLSRDPAPTVSPTTTLKHHKSKVNLDSLYNAMLEEEYGGEVGRFTRHKVRHKRRRTRQSGTELPWRFHDGNSSVNVVEYEGEAPPVSAEDSGLAVFDSAVSESSAGYPVNETRDVAPPMTYQQDEEVMSEGKQSP